MMAKEMYSEKRSAAVYRTHRSEMGPPIEKRLCNGDRRRGRVLRWLNACLDNFEAAELSCRRV